MRYFKEYIEPTTPKITKLPLLHSCSGYSFREIIKSRKLSTHKCDVFTDKNYLYTYYGIPSYRQMKKDATGYLAFFPVCFVIDYDKVPAPKKLHPFDTGAFEKLNEFRSKYFHPEMKLSNFELDPDIRDAMKVVQRYFSTNLNYMNKQCQLRKSEIDAMHFEEHSYISVIEDESNGTLDSRVSTIEFIHDSEIKLTSDSVKHIILPERFLDNKETSEIIKGELGIEHPDTYLIVKGNPNEFFGVVYNSYLDFVNNNGIK